MWNYEWYGWEGLKVVWSCVVLFVGVIEMVFLRVFVLLIYGVFDCLDFFDYLNYLFFLNLD